jgi:hypothetical protein
MTKSIKRSIKTTSPLLQSKMENENMQSEIMKWGQIHGESLPLFLFKWAQLGFLVPFRANEIRSTSLRRVRLRLICRFVLAVAISRGRVRINRPQMHIKRKTRDFRPSKKKRRLSLDKSSTNIDILVPSLYQCVETRSINSLWTVVSATSTPIRASTANFEHP